MITVIIFIFVCAYITQGDYYFVHTHFLRQILLFFTTLIWKKFQMIKNIEFISIIIYIFRPNDSLKFLIFLKLLKIWKI